MMNTELLMQLDLPTITNKYNLIIASFLLAIFFISSVHADVPTIIFPTVETEPVISPEDAADDPAIMPIQKNLLSLEPIRNQVFMYTI